MNISKSFFVILLAALLGFGLAGCKAEGDSLATNTPSTRNADQDHDGIPDVTDNCPAIANADQADADGDGIGDVCDDDRDGDGVPNDTDNCPFTANADQADVDSDGIGDVCDANNDQDNDGIDDGVDNCPTIFNPEQGDLDNDGIGDVCDDDADGDGVPNNPDNCDFTPNVDQADTDSDGIGDACEDDRDNDTILDPNDNCLETPNTDQADQDVDGIGDVCDDDRDGDGVPNGTDNCPFTANADQADTDGDGIGDVCDGGGGDPTDTDGDGIPDTTDNCPMTPNFDQADADGDGKGDVCDDDGFSCGATFNYQPLTTANYTAEGGVLGVCLGCSVDNPERSLDNDNNTFAQVNIGAALVYGGGYVKAVANDTNQDITDNTVGFVVSDPGSQLLNLSVLGNFPTIRYFNDGVEVDSATVGGGLLGLDLLGIAGNDNTRFLSAPASTQPFDSLQLDYAGLVNANATFRVHQVCVGSP
ncbi:hypothetical protein A11A3_06231 [Alcanivorax hongdengensis A-11-3]|uniref:Thrombospondin type 3 repeat-containing protein n=1 Tax=Alcanivorax hongdengensis A-11-3 TaxID=1177179 RepID=L0WE79_9GAMM|nr:thrombospondin type 3 repeat-containing protein [Alcanivorax hongdengensis]EKF75029.1 hypothetical protein A11A3_06231 [Alcanivorax hongdengensis A-11-3]